MPVVLVLETLSRGAAQSQPGLCNDLEINLGCRQYLRKRGRERDKKIKDSIE